MRQERMPSGLRSERFRPRYGCCFSSSIVADNSSYQRSATSAPALLLSQCNSPARSSRNRGRLKVCINRLSSAPKPGRALRPFPPASAAWPGRWPALHLSIADPARCSFPSRNCAVAAPRPPDPACENWRLPPAPTAREDHQECLLRRYSYKHFILLGSSSQAEKEIQFNASGVSWDKHRVGRVTPCAPLNVMES